MAEPRPTTARAGNESESGTAETGTSASQDVLQPFEVAYRTYLRVLRDSWSLEDSQRRMLEAYLDYLRAIQAADSVQNQARQVEAYLNYIRQVQQAMLPDEAKQKFAEAFSGFLGASKEAWSRADVTRIDARTLEKIAQYLQLAAAYAMMTSTEHAR